MNKMLVPVVSAWLSKINWTQAGTAATALLVALGIDIPAESKVAVLTVVTVASNVLTWIMKTWFTSTVTTASVQK